VRKGSGKRNRGKSTGFIGVFIRAYLKTVNTPKQRVFSGFQIDPKREEKEFS